MSRPPRAEVRSEKRTTIRWSSNEVQRLREAAKLSRQSISEFVRDATMTATEDCLEDDGAADARQTK